MKKARALLAALTLALASFAAVAQPASASQNYDTVYYSSGGPSSLEICHNWDITSCYDGYWYLPRGAVSSSAEAGGPRWSDTDGFYCPYSYHCEVSGFTIHNFGSGWHQLHGIAVPFTVTLTKD